MVTVLEKVLAKALLESDTELRVRMAIAHCRKLPANEHATAKQELLKHAIAFGPDFDAVRAAALAGLMALGALGDLVEIKNGDKPLKLSTGRGMDGTHKKLIGELVRKLQFANPQTAHCPTASEIS